MRVLRLDTAEAHEGVVVETECIAQRAEMFLDEIRVEAIVAGRYRRVRGEHHLRGDAANRFDGVDPFGLHPLTQQLERRECAVPLVQVRDTG